MNKELSLIEFQGMPEHEELAFRDLASSTVATYLGALLLGYVPKEKLDSLQADPEWTPKAMKVSITVNGVQLLHEHFEAMCSEFSKRMLNQRIRAGRWDDFEAAVLLKAEQLASGAFTKFNDQVFDLQQQLQHLTENAEEMVKREWNSLYAHSVTEEMLAAGMAYSVEPEHQEKPRSAYIEGLYRAMVRKKPESVTQYLDASVSKHCAPKAVEAVKKILDGYIMLEADSEKVAAEIVAAMNSQTGE